LSVIFKKKLPFNIMAFGSSSRVLFFAPKILALILKDDIASDG
jgi:hypothetical protein